MKPVTLAMTGTREPPKIIAAFDFRSLVLETHTIVSDKTLCPFHNDASPSCHIYPDGFKCYACDVHGDALDWYQQLHQLSKADAIKELEQRLRTIPTAQRTKPIAKPKQSCRTLLTACHSSQVLMVPLLTA
jgi:DNA primase